ncbi:MAG: methyltransferase [Clostridia bacterium]|nr:methyltransferase [Clostridia bacterium]
MEQICREIRVRGDLTLLQDARFFPMTQDSVLLADFAAPRLHGRGLDLGAGQGFLTVLTALRATGAAFEGLELLPGAAALAEENCRRAGLCVPVTAGDLRELPAHFKGRFDFCLCNPPYYEARRGKTAKTGTLAAARATGAGIGQVCRAAALALKDRGRLFVCFPAGRLAALARALSEHALELKILRFVREREGAGASLLLAEAVKQGGEGLSVLPDLILRDGAGNHTEEYRRIYGE